MYTHIRSQASDWNCCVKRLFVCTTVHIPYSTYHVKTNPSQMTRERVTLVSELWITNNGNTITTRMDKQPTHTNTTIYFILFTILFTYACLYKYNKENVKLLYV